MQDTSLDSTRLQITKNCGSCHTEQFKSYVGTYHGQVNTLGFAFTAKCFDCHGNHKIQRVNDPASTCIRPTAAHLPELPFRRDRGIRELPAARERP